MYTRTQRLYPTTGQSADRTRSKRQLGHRLQISRHTTQSHELWQRGMYLVVK